MLEERLHRLELSLQSSVATHAPPTVPYTLDGGDIQESASSGGSFSPLVRI